VSCYFFRFFVFPLPFFLFPRVLSSSAQ